jgi:hypothetical protein
MKQTFRMTDGEIDHGNALFCAQWLTSHDPRLVIESLSQSLTTREKRQMAARLCIIGGGLMVRARRGGDRADVSCTREAGSPS